MMPIATSPRPIPALAAPRQIRRPLVLIVVVLVFFVLYWVGIRHGLGKERNTPSIPLGFTRPDGAPHQRPRTMAYMKNGLAGLLPVRRGAHPEHPFYELMERGQSQWQAILGRQSKTLEDAVKEYKHRYLMDPPAGFAEWFAWAKAHGVVLVDEYDLMMRDILAHHALPPELYINRTGEIEGGAHTYTIDITKNKPPQLSGDRKDAARPKRLAAFIDNFRNQLPANFHLRMSGSDHDMSSVVLGKDQRRRAMDLVRRGEHFTTDELKRLEDPNRTPAWGWFKACPLDSPANAIPDAENAVDPDAPKSFIHDHISTMDFCEFPQLRRLHGALCVDRKDRSPSLLKPWLVHSKLPGDASFLIPPLEGFQNYTAADISKMGVWKDKVDPRLHWRGGTTGGYYVQLDWRLSHRMRLHLLFNGKKGEDTEWAGTQYSVMQPDGHAGYESVSRALPDLSRVYADVKLRAPALQCPDEQTCKEINDEIQFGDVLKPKDTWMFRYFLDVDGNGWSARFHRLLSTASPVLKMTMFADWNMDRLVPWYHYIPINADYSDVYDVMSFFEGPLKADGTVDRSKGHDYLAEKIGQAGQAFTLEHWRWEDMEAYLYRLLLELNRLNSLDRAAASYKHPVPAR